MSLCWRAAVTWLHLIVSQICYPAEPHDGAIAACHSAGRGLQLPWQRLGCKLTKDISILMLLFFKYLLSNTLICFSLCVSSHYVSNENLLQHLKDLFYFLLIFTINIKVNVSRSYISAVIKWVTDTTHRMTAVQVLEDFQTVINASKAHLFIM